jgi:transcriptional regulator GlxA family with amidase domain
MDTRIELALSFMEMNLERSLPLHELGSLVGLSDSRFRHIFTAETGTSPRVCLRKLRLNRAKELLAEQSQLSIGQIALKLGWQDRSHFEKRFKQLHGVTPAQYRIVKRTDTIAAKLKAAAGTATN